MVDRRGRGWGETSSFAGQGSIKGYLIKEMDDHPTAVKAEVWLLLSKLNVGLFGALEGLELLVSAY